MTLTKSHLVQSLTIRCGFSKRRSNHIVESLLEIIKGRLEAGDHVLISGFGKFGIKDRGDKRGRKPMSGNDLTMGIRRIVAFRCSSVLRDKINETD